MDAAFPSRAPAADWARGIFALAAKRRQLRDAHAAALMNLARAAHDPTPPPTPVVTDDEEREDKSAPPTLPTTEADFEALHSAVSAARAALDDHVEREREFADTTERPEPVSRATVMKGHSDIQEERIESRNGNIVIAGSVLIGNVQTGPGAGGADGIAGEPLLTILLSPAMLPTSRLQAFAKLYDLYRINACRAEYIPAVPTTEPGILIGGMAPDVQDGSQLMLFGQSLNGDLMTRSGSEGWTVFTPARIDFVFPQQAWYYCANPEVPNLMAAGVGTIAMATTPGLSKTYGMVRLFYEIEFASATSSRFGQLSIGAQYTGLTMSFSGVAQQVNNELKMPKSLVTGGTPPSMIRGAIYSATIIQTNDGANGTGWRTVYFSEFQSSITLQAGCRVYFRCCPDNATLVFYPSIGAAMSGDVTAGGALNVDVLYSTTTITPAGTCNFIVDAVNEWLMPAD